MPYAKMLVEREGALATLKLNDPAQMNAIDETMRVELIEAMSGLLDDDAVRAILITGVGDGFCAGANLREFARDLARGAKPDVSLKLRGGINELLRRMVTSPKPIVAAVNGAAAGFGCGLALAADIVLVGRSGYFVQSFVRLGATPDGGSSWFLPRLVGRGRATAMMMLGEKITADKAVEWGLAYRVFNDGELLRAGRDMAAALADGPTLAYGHIKALVSESFSNTLAGQLECETVHQEAAFATADCEEGIVAFVERRRPAFRGV